VGAAGNDYRFPPQIITLPAKKRARGEQYSRPHGGELKSFVFGLIHISFMVRG
jgi:hypothetical protein